MYEKEAKQQEEKIEKMKAEDGENYAIKKQVKPPLTENWGNSCSLSRLPPQRWRCALWELAFKSKEIAVLGLLCNLGSQKAEAGGLLQVRSQPMD